MIDWDDIRYFLAVARAGSVRAAAGRLEVNSRGLAESVAGTGVTLNAVLPGPTRSEILSNWMTKQAKDQGITPKEALHMPKRHHGAIETGIRRLL